ncbi:MAG: hypothetical protein HKN43_16640 [Rhodothermales bacterium]|nr:hypothetical protein [Rhodothermales bacterium]
MPGYKIAAAMLLTTAVVRFGYLDGPPLAHTGGFGEPSCALCHFGDTINSSEGELQLFGIEGLRAGHTSELSVELSSTGLSVAGFQMSARSPDGETIGDFRSPDINSQVLTDSTGVQYIQHTRFGTENAVVVDGIARWAVILDLAESSADTLILNVAANASNGDNSALGDRIFTREVLVPLTGPGPGQQ